VCPAARAALHSGATVPPPVVSIRNVKKRFGAFEALRGVDLQIEPGEIFALLGPNGAGKTTLISIVAGLLRASEGEVRVLGRDVVTEYRFTRRAIGLVPQEINFDPFFTVEESLRIQAGYFGIQLREERLAEILRALELAGKRTSNTRSLSGGMKRRLLIGKALVHEPQVLFLDEPTAGVDVQLRQALWSYVRVLRERGTTIVLTTHYLEEAEELADRVGVIDLGQLLVVDDKDALMHRYAGKTLRAKLSAPLASLPAPLAALGARLDDGGRSVTVTAEPGASFGPALAAFAQAGLTVKDVETERMRLEDVFVRLLRGDGAPEGRPAAPAAAARIPSEISRP
jgi:ABC-2 type transport system ATP-binding protein